MDSGFSVDTSLELPRGWVGLGRCLTEGVQGLRVGFYDRGPCCAPVKPFVSCILYASGFSYVVICSDTSTFIFLVVRSFFFIFCD